MAEYYVVNRLRQNREDEITRVNVTGMTPEQIHSMREAAIAQARVAKNLNGWRVVVYDSVIDAAPVDPDNRVWDSATDL